MRLLVWSNIIMLSVIVILSLFLSAFYLDWKEEKTMNVLKVTTENPMARYFLDNYPNAKVQGYMISEEYVEKNIEEIRKDCGDEFEEQDYWKFQYIEQRENKSMSMWIAPKTGDVVCIIQEIFRPDVIIPFGIKQYREELTVKRGQGLKESINFFNVNGNQTYYIEVKVVEKPPWELKIEPPTRLYKPVEKEPVSMNVKMEPSKLELVKPEKYPSDVTYIELEDIDGFVKSKPVTISILETPQPIPFREYEKEYYNLTLNVTSRYFFGRRSMLHESHIINYTVMLE